MVHRDFLIVRVLHFLASEHIHKVIRHNDTIFIASIPSCENTDVDLANRNVRIGIVCELELFSNLLVFSESVEFIKDDPATTKRGNFKSVDDLVLDSFFVRTVNNDEEPADFLRKVFDCFGLSSASGAYHRERLVAGDRICQPLVTELAQLSNH